MTRAAIEPSFEMLRARFARNIEQLEPRLAIYFLGSSSARVSSKVTWVPSGDGGRCSALHI